MGISIIVPIYKDWETIRLCILSLIQYTSPKNKVYLINDCSNEADELEAQIFTLIAEHPQFIYHRNQSNLGFVKTCNKAVFELDQSDNDILLLNSDTEITEGALQELQIVLYSNEQHGAVCPRSNNATLLTFPTFGINATKDYSKEEHLALFIKTSRLLPQYHVIPTGVGFCMLIKRTLIINFGLFDEVYEKGYNEENDFCMRISQYGYSTVAANHAFVFHYESKSFGEEERIQRDKTNYQILNKRYPYYKNIVNQYFKTDIHPLESLIPCMVGKPSLLFCLYEAKPHYDGTTIYGLKLLEAFYAKFKDDYDITVLAHINVIKFHNIDQLYPTVIEPHELDSKYTLVFSPSQLFFWEHLKIHLQFGLRSAFTLQDIIALRCSYLISTNSSIKRIFSNAIKYADGIIAISEVVKKDAQSYFNELVLANFDNKVKVVHHGIDVDLKLNQTASTTSLPFEDYVLVVGNHYAHKSMKLVYDALISKNTTHNFIFLGYQLPVNCPTNFAHYVSGKLTNELIATLYQKAHLVVFPSQYEGFGLPVVEALSNHKKLIVYDNAINREVVNSLYHESLLPVTYFTNFNSLPIAITEVISNANNDSFNIKGRNWNDVAMDTELVLREIINKEVHRDLIEKRGLLLNTLYDVNSSLIANPHFLSENLQLFYKLKMFAKYSQLLLVYKGVKHVKNHGVRKSLSKLASKFLRKL
jgi:GT2 family glycosyltransferase/glycosyltransferase involved in cell wall biosynthesis